MKHVVVGTAGHIDHGKSALVRALTGTDPDRLREEKERGITIDLGFAFLSDGSGLSVGFVDVPGHERFVKNMLAGVGGLDLVLLVVAADESVMPQTREHFEICRLLRIPRGLIVVTKCDLVDEDLREVAALETRELVAGSFLEDAPVLEISARTGEGVEALKAAVFEAAKRVPGRDASGVFRLPVDRVFSMKGFGTVVTGTLVAGSVAQEDEVVILPGGRRARVRGIQVHGERRDTARAGQRTAVNLQGVEVSELARGDVLVAPGTFEPTHMIDAELEVLAGSPIAVKDLTRVHLHVGTAQVLGRIRVLGGRKVLAPGERGMVQLRLEEPVVAARGDRFILRRYSPLETMAGGVVLDARPRKHSVASAEVVQHLESIRPEAAGVSSAAGAVELFVTESGVKGVSAAELARRLGVNETELLPVAEELVRRERLFAVSRTPPIYVTADVVSALSSKIEEALRGFQTAHPLLEGMSKSELREKAGAAPASTELFEWLLARLARAGRLRVARDLVATAEHRIQMSPEEARAKELLLEESRRAGYRPRSLVETASAAKADPKLLDRVQRVLLKEGTLVQIAEGMVFHRDVLEELKRTLRAHKERSDRIDVGRFKEMVGVTRKHAIPLLEWLDRERVTKRAGNERVIL